MSSAPELSHLSDPSLNLLQHAHVLYWGAQSWIHHSTTDMVPPVLTRGEESRSLMSVVVEWDPLKMMQFKTSQFKAHKQSRERNQLGKSKWLNSKERHDNNL